MPSILTKLRRAYVRTLFAIIFLCGAMSLPYSVWKMNKTAHHILAEGIEAVAMVTNKTSSTGGGSKSTRYSLQFLYQARSGKEYTQPNHVSRARWERTNRGDHILIRYDPDFEHETQIVPKPGQKPGKFSSWSANIFGFALTGLISLTLGFISYGLILSALQEKEKPEGRPRILGP